MIVEAPRRIRSRTEIISGALVGSTNSVSIESKLATGCGTLRHAPAASRARICAPCRSTSNDDGRGTGPLQMHSRFTTGSKLNSVSPGTGMPRSIA